MKDDVVFIGQVPYKLAFLSCLNKETQTVDQLPKLSKKTFSEKVKEEQTKKIFRQQSTGNQEQSFHSSEEDSSHYGTDGYEPEVNPTFGPPFDSFAGKNEAVSEDEFYRNMQAEVMQQVNTETDHKRIKRKKPSAINQKIPPKRHSESSKGGKSSMYSLPIINEEHAFRIDGSNFDTESYSQLSHFDKLPLLLRKDTPLARGDKSPTDPTMNFVYKMASSLKLDPKELLRGEDGDFARQSKRIQTEREEIEISEIRRTVEQLMTLSDHTYTRKNSPERKPSARLEMARNYSQLQEATVKRRMSGLSVGVKDLTEEFSLTDMLRIKVQMNIQSIALRQNQQLLRNLDVELKSHVNKQSRHINRLITNLMRQNKQLHFAFLFACPLVLSCGADKYKLIPQLDHEREYLKIKQRIEAAQCQITISKRQCTTESFRQVLMRRPLGIHFSGHGVINSFETVGDYHELTKDQGDFLLFETEQGDSQLVSRKQLTSLIDATCASLDFVFVASCHSEFVGHIFLEAGSRHVICIDHKQEVDDNAVMTFTDAFYDAVFSNVMSVCKAFVAAQAVVSINNGPDQAKIFKLLKLDAQRTKGTSPATFGHLQNKEPISTTNGWDTSKTNIPSQTQSQPLSQKSSSIVQLNFLQKVGSRKHSCSTFGKFPKGMFRELVNEPQLQIGLVEQPMFMARQKDMFELVQRILSHQSSRLLTLLGVSGIGKSSLVQRTLQHINQRQLLPGGFVVLNIRGVKNCLMLRRAITSKVFEGWAAMVGIEISQDSEAATELILEKLALFNQRLIWVIDDAEDLISADRNSFKQTLVHFLSQVPKLSILLTSRIRLKLQGEISEDVMLLYGLPAQQAVCLFIKQASRQLTTQEINELLRIKPDPKRYPGERNKSQPTKLQEHHLFSLIGGNPSIIGLLAPMLSDPAKPLNLTSLYLALSNHDEGCSEFGSVIQVGVRLALESIEDSASLELLYLLSMLPHGVGVKELDSMWTQLRTLARRSRINDPDKSFAKTSSSLEVDETTSTGTWKSAYQRLTRHRLARESSNTDGELEISIETSVIGLVSSQIPSETYELISSMISDFYKREFAQLYTLNQTTAGDTVSRQLLKHQANFTSFIQRKVDMTYEQSESQAHNERSSDEEVELSVANANKSAPHETPFARAKRRWQAAFRNVRKQIVQKRMAQVKLGTCEVDSINDSDPKNKTPAYSAQLIEAQQATQNWQQVRHFDRIKSARSQLSPLVTSNLDRELSFVMADDELAIVYYLMNLLLLGQNSLAIALIKQLSNPQGGENSGATFQGNLHRIDGYCKLQLVKQALKRKSSLELQTINEVKQCYRKSIACFQQCGQNHWGVGLAQYALAEVLCFTEELRVRQNATLPSKLERAMLKLDQAEDSFRQVNHCRGQALVCKLIVSLLQLGKEDGNVHDLIQQQESLYSNFLQHSRDQQRRLKPTDTRQELFIDRLKSDSIHSEIVHGLPGKRGLFTKEIVPVQSEKQLLKSIRSMVSLESIMTEVSKQIVAPDENIPLETPPAETSHKRRKIEQ